MLKTIWIVLSIAHVQCDSIPKEKCKMSDKVCMKTAFQGYLPTFLGGDPQLGTQNLEILDLDEVDFNISGFTFNLKDGQLKGLKNSIVDSAKFDTKKKQMEVEFHLNCTIRGHYKAGGKILILPITGDGDMKLKLRNVAVKFVIPYEIEKNTAGKECLIPKKYILEFEVKEGLHSNLTNLFNGNKDLSDAMLSFVNQNWKVMTVDFGRPMIDASANKIYQNIATFLKNTPIDDLFLTD